MTERIAKESFTLWQESSEDSVPEPAFLIVPHSDVVRIQQGGDQILLNYESVDELCKVLKQIKKNRK